MGRVLRTKEIFDEALMERSERYHRRPYISPVHLAPLIGVSEQSLRRYFIPHPSTQHVSLDHVNEHITWQHRAFNIERVNDA